MAAGVPEFQGLLTQLAADLGVKIGRLLRTMDRLDQREARAFITEYYPALALPYMAAAGSLSAQYYNEQPTLTAFLAQPVDLIPVERLAVSGRWALLQRSPVQALVGSAQRAVMDQSRTTMLENLAVEYDVPVAEVSVPGTRWARHASANACGFCRMLATRGPVYRSRVDATRVSGRSVDLTIADKRALMQGRGFIPTSQLDKAAVDEALERRTRFASWKQARKQGKLLGDLKVRRDRGIRALGDKYHDDCHCIAVPVRPGGSYEPPEYVEQWERDYVDAVGATREAGKTRGDYGAIDVHAVAAHMDNAPGGSGPKRRRDRAERLRRDARPPETAGGGSGTGRVPPNRFTPKGMDAPDEYPPMDYHGRVRLVPFAPKDRPQPTAEDIERVLSKHRHGAGVPNKSEFPADWSDDDIVAAIDLTMAAPDTLAPGGDKIVFERTIDGVLVRVTVRVDLDPPAFWSAYPPRDTVGP